MTEKKQYKAPDSRIIHDVIIRPLKVIPDERGRLMEIMRCDDDFYSGFGQVYLSTVYPGVVKAWHYHKNQDDRFTCVKGMVKAVLYDDRPDSPTRGALNQFYVGEYNPCIVVIPRGVFHGWKCISETEAYVINIPSEPYNREHPDEFRADPHNSDIPYDWSRKDG